MIRRDPDGCSRDRYDLVIIGGGIYGVCLSLEASRRGIRSLLIERDDFGGATTWNSLRILHGGLRYLQNFDLPRFRESVSERRWFCRNFPDLVRPLPCLMPLYGRGLKRKSVFSLALRMNDWLSADRNSGVVPQVSLPAGRVLSPAETAALFPLVERRGLEGAGLWHDAVMINSQRILIEILRWACGLGGRALNYVEASEVLTSAGQVIGVRAFDRLGGRHLELRTERVVNCAGPWCRELAAAFDREIARLFRPSLAFNVFLDRAPLSPAALAVEPQRNDSQVYFMHPWKGGILLGTIHAPWEGRLSFPEADEHSLEALVADVNRAIKGFDLRRSDIRRVYAGLLPVEAAGAVRLARRPVLYIHGRNGGPRGLLSVSGIKFTTARRVVEQALFAANPAWTKRPYLPGSERRAASRALDLHDARAFLAAADSTARAELARLVDEEAATCVEDLLLRRTDWGLDPGLGRLAGRRISELFSDLAPEPKDVTRSSGLSPIEEPESCGRFT